MKRVLLDAAFVLAALAVLLLVVGALFFVATR